MANEKIMNTRIQLKYDTLEAWNSSTFKLKAGEVAVATIDTWKIDETTQKKVLVPTCLLKVGDDNKTFSELNWVAAQAADVYDWAKKSEAEFTSWVKTLIEVSDIDLSNYYTKSEVDGLIADIDTGVMAIATGTENGTIAVDGSDVAVKGLKSAAFEAKEAFDVAGAAAAILGTDGDRYYPFNGTEPEHPSAYTVHSAINLAQTKISDIYGSDETITVEDASDWADVGGDVAKSLHVNISTKYGNALEVISAYSDEEAGEAWSGGLYVNIPEAPKYNIVKDTNSGSFAAVYHLTENGKNIGAAINIPKDMVVESGKVVTYTEETDGQVAGTYIKLKLQNVNDALYINVGDLIEYVTGDTAKDGIITITVDENYIATAVINDGTITKTKLEASVQTSLGKADTAVQPADIGTMAKETATDYVKKSEATGYADILTKTAAEGLYQAKGEYATAEQGEKADNSKQKQTAVASKFATSAHVLSSLSQNENGDIAYEVKELTPADIGAQPAGDYATKTEMSNQDAAILAEAQKYADGLNHEDTKYAAAADGGLKLNENNEFAIDDNVTFVFYCGSATELI